MDVKDLQPGDILLYTPTDCCGKIIAWMTNSHVCHAALYLGYGYVAEEVGSGLRRFSVEESCRQRTMYIRRFQPQKDMRPVTDIAETYLKKGEGYGNKDIAALALILLSKGLFPPFAVELMKAIAAFLLNIPDKEGKTPMICSQFVYVCFEEAVPAHTYKLIIENGVITPPPNALDAVINQVKTSFQHQTIGVLETEVKNILDEFKSLSEEDLYSEIERLCKSLWNAISQTPSPTHTAATEFSGDELAAVKCLAFALESVKSEKLSKESYFVVPADLFSRCVNTSYVEQIIGIGRYVPKGSYLNSSTRIAAMLSACRSDQTTEKTVLDITIFDDDTDIENNNGILQFTDNRLSKEDIDRLREKRKKLGLSNYVPIGSYLDSAKEISVKLSADCQKIGGEYSHSELDITKLDDNRDIKNNEGKLEY